MFRNEVETIPPNTYAFEQRKETWQDRCTERGMGASQSISYSLANFRPESCAVEVQESGKFEVAAGLVGPELNSRAEWKVVSLRSSFSSSKGDTKQLCDRDNSSLYIVDVVGLYSLECLLPLCPQVLHLLPRLPSQILELFPPFPVRLP